MEGLPITKIKEVSELIVREGELISFNNLTTGPVNVGSYSSCSGSVEDDSVVFNFLGCLRGFSQVVLQIQHFSLNGFLKR